MNELIFELAQQAGAIEAKTITNIPRALSLNGEEIEKFAELIVRECLEQVRDEVQYEYDWKLADAVTKRVMEHFGVEE